MLSFHKTEEKNYLKLFFEERNNKYSTEKVLI